MVLARRALLLSENPVPAHQGHAGHGRGRFNGETHGIRTHSSEPNHSMNFDHWPERSFQKANPIIMTMMMKPN